VLYLYYDSLGHPGGGIGTYLHAIAMHLHEQGVPFRLFVNEVSSSPLADDLERAGVPIDRQRRLPGDRFQVGKRVMQSRLARRLRPGDWVFSLCPPDPAIYSRLVRIAHARGAKLAVSWYLAPEFWPLDLPGLRRFSPHLGEAIRATDLLVSVSKCTVDQFKEQYAYDGPTAVVPYHNLPIFQNVVPLPPGPPWKIGFIGRLEARQKNLDGVLRAFAAIRAQRTDIELHLHGGGSSREELAALARELGVERSVHFHGEYDHRRDLPAIVAGCHFFLYPSRSEGGPCFSVLELMQAGRLCVVSDVGGLPDLFRGYPELGILVPREDHAALVRAIREALVRVAAGEIDAEKIRARYHDHWDMEAAHRALMKALGGMGVPPM
jgi:glycosyltransferase involved in cell wall biosynthesis